MASNEVPQDPSQVISLDMEPEEAPVVTVQPTYEPQPSQNKPASKSFTWMTTEAPKATTLPRPVLDEKVLSWDAETTGTNPWDDRLVVVSFWDLSLPPQQMVTFADWDEEALVREIAAWLNDQAPDCMTGFNTAFDIRHLASRCMFYQVPCPALLACRHDDTRDFMKKGTWKSVFSDQASGTLEEWATYLYDEKKPYTIEEIFAGMDEGDLNPTIIRNRWDVYIEGQLYLLTKYVQFGDMPPEFVVKPTLASRDEAKEAGVVSTACPVCKTINDFPLDQIQIRCYVCDSNIPRPAALGMLQEYTRPIITPAEAAAQAAAAKKATAAKKTTTAKA